MSDKRKHKRYRLDLLEVDGKIILAQKVEVIDISLGGISLKTDRRLNIGKEYVIKLVSKDMRLEVRGVIVRCELSGIEQRGEESVSIYSAAMMFRDVPAERIAEFIKPIEKGKRPARLISADRRLHVRFYMTTATEQTISFPAHFSVKVIGEGGMCIRTKQPFAAGARAPMGLFLQETNTIIDFIGRIVSCDRVDGAGDETYEVGVAFENVRDDDRALLTEFVEYLAEHAVQGKNERAQGEATSPPA